MSSDWCPLLNPRARTQNAEGTSSGTLAGATGEIQSGNTEDCQGVPRPKGEHFTVDKQIGVLREAGGGEEALRNFEREMHSLCADIFFLIIISPYRALG